MDAGLIKVRVEVEKLWPGEFTHYFRKYRFKSTEDPNYQSVWLDKDTLDDPLPTIVYNVHLVGHERFLIFLLSTFFVADYCVQLKGLDVEDEARCYAAERAAMFRMEQWGMRNPRNGGFKSHRAETIRISASQFAMHEMMHSIHGRILDRRNVIYG